MKKFNKLLKSKNKIDEPHRSSSSAATANNNSNNNINSDDVRAQYYAQRSNNPFDDSPSKKSNNSSNKPSQQQLNQNNNPFDDDSEEDADDDDDDDPLARFAKKKPPAAVTSVTAVTASNITSSNPFEEESEVKVVSSNITNRLLEQARSAKAKQQQQPPSISINYNNNKSKTNPFDDESVIMDADDADNIKTTVNSKTGNNPFDDESSSPVKRAGGKNNNPFDSPVRSNVKSLQSTRVQHQPTANVVKSAAVTEKTGNSNNNNPFDDSPTIVRKKDAVTAKPSQQQPANSRPLAMSMTNKPPAVVKPTTITTTTSSTLARAPPNRSVSSPIEQNNNNNNNAMNPPTSLSASVTMGGGADKRKLWRGFNNTNTNEGNHYDASTNNNNNTTRLLERMDEEESQSTHALNHFKGGGGQSNISGNAAGLASWLRRNQREDDHHHHHQATTTTTKTTTATNAHHNSPKKKKSRKKCKAVITAWPFDNFHEVQERQLQYEELASRAASDYNTHIQGSDNEDDHHDDNNNHHGFNATTSSENKYYERPEELPGIKEAVTNLPLVDFEKKAEERAINIVSTWLFDAGLIDELLVNGATAAAAPASSNAVSFSDNMTVKSSEGVEIGSHGFPLLGSIEGAEQKIDKETNKLRGMISRDLSIINARLNDGVAASGCEVQELVNAVAATKADIGRLRELTTYISDAQMSDRDEFLLAKYPHLRGAIHARRNINRCFRELEFFSQIPSTCDRLRDELHGGEWTEEEWSTIRNVAMEHVELEIMLVEAETSMKAGKTFNDAMVDNFLDSHVQNVWELGDEIRMRMLSGIGSAFELAINNPAGMVALVEAVEVYEKAAESFEKKRQESNVQYSGKLRFTNMRAAALEQLYQDFELRGVEMFRGIHELAADMAEAEDASNAQFTAVLKAATELVTEIDVVKHQMSPCFAPHWQVEALWSSCVAHVCSNHIIQQIGGPDGQNLPELTITQLLELVAWVEYFRETIEETFPEVAEMHDTRKPSFEERPDLFGADKRTVNMSNCRSCLAWVNNMLWEVHRLAQEEFLVRTRSQTDEWLDKVYESETVKNQSAEGKLTTSLCEDVFSFSSVQLRTIRERLSKKSDALILAVCIILSHMRSKQVHSRNNFLEDLETCCAASNDFTRMSEKCEDVCTDLIAQCEFTDDMIATIEASSNELMVVYSSDAVYAARSVHIYVFDPIEEEIGTRLFEQAWEEDMVDNDLALSLIRTLEDFYDDLDHFMDDFMVVKSVMSLMSATVIFYVKCLLLRAEKHKSNKKPYFSDVPRALSRMTGDIKVMRQYFEGLVPKMPALKKNIEKDFEILSTVHELMSIAAGLSISEAEDFILVLQKRVRDVSITKHIVGDLWHLVAPTDERYVWELVESMEQQLVAIAPADDALSLEVNDRSYVKGLRLDEMSVKLYVKSKRKRPVQSTTTEKIVYNWRTTWAVRADEGNVDENQDAY